LAALTRKFTLDKNVSLVGIARRCPVNFTGADMYALCADAWLQATKRKVARRDNFTGSSDIKEADDNIVVVKQDDFFKALGELTPSLSRAELDRYERLRIQFEGQGTRSTSSSA
jgi:peroxin-6